MKILALLFAAVPFLLPVDALAETSTWRGVMLQRSGTVQGCGSGRTVNVVEGDGKIMMMERSRNWTYWTLAQNQDGSAAGEVEESSINTRGKRTYRIKVPPGSGPRTISLLFLEMACVYELAAG